MRIADTGVSGLIQVSVLLAACGGAPDAPGGDRTEKLVTPGLSAAIDLDPNPSIVRVNLTAQASTASFGSYGALDVATYEQSLPGPLLRAKRGDRLIVELRNDLDEPTTLHWHGVRVPNAMDGVPGETQPAVLPGETFEYDFVLPDAGLFWYHPHYAAVSQLGNGLYGPLLVDDPEDEPGLGKESVLVLSDLDESADRNRPVDEAALLAGREGSILLVNGLIHPELGVRRGERQRFRVLNAARSQYFRLGLAGHRFHLIGGDAGRFSAPLAVAEPVLGPGERLDLLLDPEGEAGDRIELEALPFSRGLPLPESSRRPLLTLVFDEPGAPAPELGALTRPVAPLDASQASVVPVSLTMSSLDAEVRMGINGVPFGEGEMLHARVGESQILEVVNESPVRHPFHLHGFTFQRLDASRMPVRPVQPKDTIDIPPLGTEHLLVHYDDRPGVWMFHCHILDHAEAGMMGMIHLEP
jgi:FtsP/CotA-like multicopper oxidase with cupredoxin domain